MDSNIPKIIMQTWKTDELPEKWKSTQSSIREYMSNWQYVLMTDNDNRDFVKNHFPDFLITYDNFKYPIQRADAIRYCWLYIHGGLYMDCDFELLESLEELFETEGDLFLVSSSNTKKVITNGFMAAKPGNKLWLDMIEEMKKSPPLYSYIDKHLYVMQTTGPMALTRVINRTNPSYNLIDNEKVNPYTLCEVVYGEKELERKPGALLKPLEGSSWVSGTGEIYQWCYCNTNYVVIWIIVIILILLLILFMMWNYTTEIIKVGGTVGLQEWIEYFGLDQISL